MSDLKHLADRYYEILNELDIYFKEHVEQELDACTTKEDLRAVMFRLSREVADSEGQIRDLPGNWPVKFVMRFNVIEFGG